MKKTNLLLFALLVPALFLWTSCGDGNEDNAGSDTTEVVLEVNHTQLLLDKIVENGDFINSLQVPTLISAEDVHANLANNFLILDLRTAKNFAAGHIEGAINLKMKDLPDYFEGNDTEAFDKIVLVCHSGQTASYATSALQLSGYNNVYAMKWGMSSWNPKFAGKWLNAVSDKYADQLQVEVNVKGAAGTLPKFECMPTDRAEILKARVNKILNDNLSDVLITADVVFDNPGDYYIVNYWPESAYIMGHITGSFLYTPKSSLGLATDLLTLPTDKKIVVYCFTGQHSAFVTAYLRILGYDAYSLKYGANSFMNKVMKDNEDLGHAFTKNAINKFEFETSKYEAEDGAVEEEGGC